MSRDLIETASAGLGSRPRRALDRQQGLPPRCSPASASAVAFAIMYFATSMRISTCSRCAHRTELGIGKHMIACCRIGARPGIATITSSCALQLHARSFYGRSASPSRPTYGYYAAANGLAHVRVLRKPARRSRVSAPSCRRAESRSGPPGAKPILPMRAPPGSLRCLIANATRRPGLEPACRGARAMGPSSTATFAIR